MEKSNLKDKKRKRLFFEQTPEELFEGAIMIDHKINDTPSVSNNNNTLSISNNNSNVSFDIDTLKRNFREACLCGNLPKAKECQKAAKRLGCSFYDSDFFNELVVRKVIPDIITWYAKKYPVPRKVICQEKGSFQIACDYGYDFIVHWFIIEYGIKYNEFKNNYSIESICEKGHMGVLEILIKCYPALKEDYFWGGKCYHLACKSGNISLLEYLDTMCTVESYSLFEETGGFIWACKTEDDRVLTYLFKKHQDIVDKIMYHLEYVMRTACFHSYAAVDFLLKNAVIHLYEHPSVVSKCLLAAVWAENEKTLLRLLECNNNKMARHYYKPAFRAACENNLLSFAQTIEKYAFFYGIVFDNDFSLFHDLCVNGYVTMLQWLADKGYIIPACIYKENNQVVFFSLYEDKHLSVIRWLVEWGEMKQPDNHNLLSLFLYACDHGSLKIVKWMIEERIAPDIHIDNDLPFRLACGSGSLALVMFFLDQGMQMSNVIADNNDAYKRAYYNHHTSITQLLNERFKLSRIPKRSRK